MDVSVVSLQRLRFRVCTEIAESFRRFFLEGCGLPWRQAGSAVNKEEAIHLFFFYKIGYLMFPENEQLKQLILVR